MFQHKHLPGDLETLQVQSHKEVYNSVWSKVSFNKTHVYRLMSIAYTK